MAPWNNVPTASTRNEMALQGYTFPAKQEQTCTVIIIYKRQKLPKPRKHHQCSEKGLYCLLLIARKKNPQTFQSSCCLVLKNSFGLERKISI